MIFKWGYFVSKLDQSSSLSKDLKFFADRFLKHVENCWIFKSDVRFRSVIRRFAIWLVIIVLVICISPNCTVTRRSTMNSVSDDRSPPWSPISTIRCAVFFPSVPPLPLTSCPTMDSAVDEFFLFAVSFHMDTIIVRVVSGDRIMSISLVHFLVSWSSVGLNARHRRTITFGSFLWSESWSFSWSFPWTPRFWGCLISERTTSQTVSWPFNFNVVIASWSSQNSISFNTCQKWAIQGAIIFIHIFPFPLLLFGIPTLLAVCIPNLFALKLILINPLSSIIALSEDLSRSLLKTAIEISLSDDPSVVLPAFSDFSVYSFLFSAVWNYLFNIPSSGMNVIAFSLELIGLTNVSAVRNHLSLLKSSSVNVIAFLNSGKSLSFVSAIRDCLLNFPLSCPCIIALMNCSVSASSLSALSSLLQMQIVMLWGESFFFFPANNYSEEHGTAKWNEFPHI